jgi:hypothetical protein
MKHTKLQQFFKERLKELFHKETIDSHRVRFHNTNSLLKELRTLIVDWKKNKIKQFETVRLCAQELIDSLKNDDYISMGIYNKELFIKDLETMVKCDGTKFNGSHELFILDKLINENKTKYLAILFQNLEQLVLSGNEFPDEEFIPKANKIDNVVSLLGTELINCGFSKSYIYSCVAQLCFKPHFVNQFNIFKDKFLSEYIPTFVVVYKIWTGDIKLSECNIPYIYEEIPDEYLSDNLKDKYIRFLQKEENFCFFIWKEKAKDYYSAIKKSKAKLSFLLDQIHLGVYTTNISIPENALVINLANKERGTDQPTNYFTDGKYGSDITLFQEYNKLIHRIEENKNVQQDVKDRLNSALRYLRLGNTTIEMEQRFINYWIALEFLFSSPETKENTFTRLKNNLVNILFCSYAKRNLMLLNEVLIKKGYVDSGSLYWEVAAEDQQNLINRINKPLLRYQVQKMKAHMFVSSDRRKEYLNNHETNLNQHIVRIYRLRNELIHEAAIKQDIENITSNLRYYLVFLLNQMIVYFANIPTNSDICRHEKAGMDDLFNEYILWKKQIVQQEYDKDILLAIPLEMDLIV